MTDGNTTEGADGTDRAVTQRSHGSTLAVIRAVAAAENRRFEHRHTASRRKRALGYVGLAILLPIVGAVLWGGYLFGEAIADGGADGVLNLARWYLPVAVVGYAFVSGAETAKKFDDFGARDLNLTAVPSHVLSVGLLYADLRKRAWSYAAIIVPVVAFAAGVESPATALIAVPAAGLLLAISILLGYVLGLAARIGLDALPVSSRVRSLIGGIVSTGGVFVLFAGLGAYAASLEIDPTNPGELAATAPEGSPPVPLGYYADLFFVGTPLVDGVSSATLASAVLLLGTVPALTWAIVVLAPRVWYADPVTPARQEDDLPDGSAKSTVDRPSADDRREWPWLEYPTGYVADGIVRRAIRSPGRSMHLLYYVVALSVLLINVVFVPEAALTILGSALVMLGIWLAGGAVGLNPLGEEGSMLEQLVLSDFAPETYVNARIAVGLVLGTPLVLVGTALLAVDSLSLGNAALAGAYWLALVPASAGLAVGVGTLLPAAEPGTVFERFDARPPEKLAQLIHGALTAVAAYGGGQLIVSSVDPLVRWGGLALVVATLGIAADAGYRYAVNGIAEYGRPRSPDPVYAFELVTGLALLGLVCSLTVAEGVAILVPVSGQELFVLLVVANFAGWAVPGVAYLVAAGQSIDDLDIRRPSTRDVAYLAAGLVASLVTYAILVGGTWVFGGPEGGHPIAGEIADGGLALLGLFVAVAILVNGPVEEFFFRNVLQKRLAETTSPPRAIAVISGLFALVHVPVYGSFDVSTVAVTLFPLFALSLVWGWIYHRTENLLVPALCHGLYNAIVFGVVYFAAL